MSLMPATTVLTWFLESESCLLAVNLDTSLAKRLSVDREKTRYRIVIQS